jgi:hypothetical protein
MSYFGPVLRSHNITSSASTYCNNKYNNQQFILIHCLYDDKCVGAYLIPSQGASSLVHVEYPSPWPHILTAVLSNSFQVWIGSLSWGRLSLLVDGLWEAFLSI